MRIYKKKMVWELFTRGEGISTLHARHKRRYPLIECAQRDFKIVYFPFFVFFTFWGRQGCCPCSYVFLSAIINSDLHSSLKKKELCVELILGFWKIHFLTKQEQKEAVKALDLERSQVTLMERNSVICWFHLGFNGEKFSYMLNDLKTLKSWNVKTKDIEVLTCKDRRHWSLEM